MNFLNLRRLLRPLVCLFLATALPAQTAADAPRVLFTAESIADLQARLAADDTVAPGPSAPRRFLRLVVTPRFL